VCKRKKKKKMVKESFRESVLRWVFKLECEIKTGETKSYYIISRDDCSIIHVVVSPCLFLES
jgi:hypothetical protein